MIFIKHRFTDFEDAGLLDVYDGLEVDIRELEGNLYVGHDMPEKRITIELLKYSKIWAHAKDERAYKILLENGVRCFMHDKEPIARVETGYFWTCRPSLVCDRMIFMDSPGNLYALSDLAFIRNAYGICSDYPEIWKQIFEERK